MLSMVKGLVDKLVSLLKGIVSDKKKLIPALVLLALVFLICKGVSASNAEKAEKERVVAEAQAQAESEQAELALTQQSNSDDSILLQQQPELIKSFGKVPEGYIWNTDGTLLSLGDKDMSAEEVVYAYLSGIRTLDFSMAQKYSRGSSVVANYSEMFSSDGADADYYDSFLRNMYKEALLSMKVESVADNSVFAENKQVFTVNIEMLDLTDKEFWQADKDQIYSDLYVYSSDEDDTTKSEIYLYDYVLNHYKSDKAKTRVVTVNLTVERYPDLDTGWLVSADSDIDNACNYSDGTLMVNYINKMYAEEGVSYIQDKRSHDTEKEGE